MSIHGGVPKHLDDKNMLKIQDDLKCRNHLDMGQDNVDVYMDLYGSIWIYMDLYGWSTVFSSWPNGQWCKLFHRKFQSFLCNFEVVQQICQDVHILNPCWKQ